MVVDSFKTVLEDTIVMAGSNQMTKAPDTSNMDQGGASSPRNTQGNIANFVSGLIFRHLFLARRVSIDLLFS